MWEWIEDHFNGLGDFKAHLLYDDFSTPCFDGRHNMIMVCDFFKVIGHFRVSLGLSKCEAILMKITLICMKMKLQAELIFIRKVSHLDSF